MVEDLLHLLQGRVSMIVLKLVIGIATARIWGPAAVGIIALAMQIPKLVVDGVDLGTKKSLPFLIGRSGKTIQEVTSTAIMMWVLVSAVSMLVAGGIVFSPIMHSVPPLWGLLGVLTIPVSLFAGYCSGYAIGVQRLAFFKHMIWWRDPITLLVVVVGGLALGANTPDDGWIRLLAEVLGVGFAGIVGVRLIRAHASLTPRMDVSLMRAMIGHSFKFGLGMWSMQVNYRIGLVLLGLSYFQVSAAAIGNYSRALVVAMMLWQLPGMLGTIVFSRGVNTTDPLEAARKAALIARVTTIAGIPFAVALWIAAPWLMPLAYGPGFALSGEILRVFVPGMLTFFLARVFDADLSARGRPLCVMAVMAPLAVLNVGLAVLLIPRYGASGAAWATSCCFVLGSIALGIVFARVTGMGILEVFLPRVRDFRLVFERLRRFASGPLGRIRPKR